MHKQRFIQWIFFFLLATTTSFGSAYDNIPQGVINAFQTGNAEEISAHFNTRLEMILLDKENVYSKSQAKIILAEFLKTHPPRQFTLLHKGGKHESRYAIGTFQCQGRKYRVTIYFKNMNKKPLIYQLRIEYDNNE